MLLKRFFPESPWSCIYAAATPRPDRSRGVRAASVPTVRRSSRAAYVSPDQAWIRSGSGPDQIRIKSGSLPDHWAFVRIIGVSVLQFLGSCRGNLPPLKFYLSKKRDVPSPSPTTPHLAPSPSTAGRRCLRPSRILPGPRVKSYLEIYKAGAEVVVGLGGGPK